MVRLGAHRLPGTESGGIADGGDHVEQSGGCDRGVCVDAGQIDSPPRAGGGIDLVGGRRPSLRPACLVPAVPDHGAGVRRGIVTDQIQAVPQRPGRRQVQARQLQAQGGDVHMRIDEGGGDESAVQVDDFGVRMQCAPRPVGTQPHHRAIGDRHRGGIGGTGTVDTAADQQLGTHG